MTEACLLTSTVRDSNGNCAPSCDTDDLLVVVDKKLNLLQRSTVGLVAMSKIAMFSPATRVQVSASRHHHGMFTTACNVSSSVRKWDDLGLVRVVKPSETQLSMTAFAPSHELSSVCEAQHKVPSTADLSCTETYVAVTWVYHLNGQRIHLLPPFT